MLDCVVCAVERRSPCTLLDKTGCGWVDEGQRLVSTRRPRRSRPHTMIVARGQLLSIEQPQYCVNAGASSVTA